MSNPYCTACDGHITITHQRIYGVGIADFYTCENCGLIAPDSNTITYKPEHIDTFKPAQGELYE